jgi:hypothetical protein
MVSTFLGVDDPRSEQTKRHRQDQRRIGLRNHYSYHAIGLGISKKRPNRLHLFSLRFSTSCFDNTKKGEKVCRIPLCPFNCLALLFSLLLSVTQAETPVGGKLSGQVTWRADGNPHVMNQNLEVPQGASLTIEPGVEVKLRGQSITIQGRLIAKGTEEKQILFTTKNSESPKAADWGPFQFQAGSSESILENVVIEYGMGLILHRSNLTINQCTIRHHHKEYGGGIYAIGCKPTISNCNIQFNVADRTGGGIRAMDSVLTVMGCTITCNSARHEGGGISIDYSVSRIEGNTISSNWAMHGGGIATGTTQVGQTSMTGSSHSRPTIRNNRILNNWALFDGGGLVVTGTPDIIQNLIMGNRLQSPSMKKEPKKMQRDFRDTGLGAGILVEETYGGPLNIQANTIAGNCGAFWGSAIAVRRASGKIEQNMIVGNKTLEDGGAISLLLSTSSASFVSKGHGAGWIIAGNEMRSNQGGAISLEVLNASDKQTAAITSNILRDNSSFQISNATQVDIQATGNDWGTMNSDDIASSIIDYYDQNNRGRVLFEKPSGDLAMKTKPKLSLETLNWASSCPDGFRAGQGLSRLPDTPPSITATWKPSNSSKTAGYLVHIAAIAPQFRDVDFNRDLRVFVRCNEGTSPVDVGNVNRTVLTGFEIGKWYELSVSAYDFDGNESTVSEPMIVKVER